MRAAIAVFACELGGVDTFMHQLARALEGAGHQVSFVECHHRGDAAGEARARSIEVLDCTRRWWRSPARHAARIAETIDNFDAVFVVDVPELQSAFGLVRPEVAVVPVVQLNHPSFVANALINAAQCPFIVGVSPELEEALAARIDPALRGRIRYVPNMVEVPDAFPRSVVPERGRPLDLLFAGRMADRQKRVLLLPEVMARLEGLGVRARLHLAGDGPDAGELRRRLAAAVAADRVVWHGRLRRDETRALMARCDALLMPSAYEGMPFVMLEAMSAGAVPVVSLIAGVTDRVVRDGENGVLVAGGEAADFAAAIAALDADRGAIARMAREAWVTVREEYHAGLFAQRYLALLEQAVREAPGIRRRGAILESALGEYPRLPFALQRAARRLAPRGR